MTDLSPAAQAVLTAQAKKRCLNEWDHVNDPPCHPSDKDWNGCYQCIDRRGLAAGLRAVAERNEYKANLRDEMEVMFSEGWNGLRKELLAIADELEALPDD
jgi:hypothetical protein